MSTPEPESRVERPAEASEYLKWLNKKIPASQRPYVLARMALATFSHDSGIFAGLSERAFSALKSSNDGVLKPRLDAELEREVGHVVEDMDRTDREGSSLASTEAGAFLLAWVVHHGNTDHHHESDEVKG